MSRITVTRRCGGRPTPTGAARLPRRRCPLIACRAGAARRQAPRTDWAPHASHVDVVGAPHRLGRPRVPRVVGHAVQVLLQLVQDLPLACRVRLFVCVCVRARRTARQPAAPRGADPFTREADGDRNAELSNANKSFADHRVTGDPPYRACLGRLSEPQLFRETPSALCPLGSYIRYTTNRPCTEALS